MSEYSKMVIRYLKDNLPPGKTIEEAVKDWNDAQEQAWNNGKIIREDIINAKT